MDQAVTDPQPDLDHGLKVGQQLVVGGPKQSPMKSEVGLYGRRSVPRARRAQSVPLPSHFEQASELVSKDTVAEAISAWNRPRTRRAGVRKYLEAAYDEVILAR
jgi:hypothetical protein